MDIAKRLDLFLDVARQGSYTKAANLREMDRSSLSKQIRALEKELGIRLLNRSTRSVQLTEAGKEVVKQAELVRQTISDTYRIVESFHSKPKGLLRITSPTLFGKLYVHKVIKQFMQNYPGAHVHLTLDNKKLNVIEDRYDIAFRIGHVDELNMIAVKLADNKPVVLASESFIQEYGEPRTPAELVELPAVFFADEGLVVNRIPIVDDSKTGERKFWEIYGRYRTNEPELILDAIQAGLGFGVMTQYMLGRSLKELGLVPLLTDYTSPEYFGGIYAVYPHRNPALLVSRFIEMMQEEIGEVPVWERHHL